MHESTGLMGDTLMMTVEGRECERILYNTVKLSQPLKAKPGSARELGHSTSTSCGWACSKLAIL